MQRAIRRRSLNAVNPSEKINTYLRRGNKKSEELTEQLHSIYPSCIMLRRWGAISRIPFLQFHCKTGIRYFVT